jgi:hypothetical protein
MKLGTDRNPKFIQFMDVLNVSRPMAVGLLELLWHSTAEFAPQGDIGRFDNKGIAKLVGWRGSPDVLVDALVLTRWLDPCREHRLLVHDWRDHAPDFLKKRLERGKLCIFQAITPTADNGGQVCLPNPTVPCLTESKPSLTEPNQQHPPPAASGFEVFWKSYPRKIGKKAAEKAWARAKDKPALEVILAAVKAQAASDQWLKDGGQFIPHPATWLNQGRWSDEPPAPQPQGVPRPSGGPKSFHDAARERSRRDLEEAGEEIARRAKP